MNQTVSESTVVEEEKRPQPLTLKQALPPSPKKEEKKNSPMVPKRVKDALEKSKDFGEFRNNREFVFLHLFAGPSDRLGKALVNVGEKAGLKVRCRAIDIKINPRDNLKDVNNWVKVVEDIDKGEYDGFHGGYPCSSFSQLRWRPSPGMPGPVRSSESPYGLPSNTVAQQAEADTGTLRATWTVSLMERQANSMRDRGLPEQGTVENPPGTKERTEGPSWDLPEIKKVMGRMNASSVEFNTCSYMSKSKVRFFKPAKWAGKLQDMASLSRVCRCPNWVIHKPVVGAVSVEAGVYPDELCEAVAEKVVATWKRVLSLEFYRDRLETKSQEVSSLQKQWLSNENRRNKRSWEEMTSHSLPETKEPKVKLKSGEVSESVKARSSGLESTKERKEKENKFYVGGMRNPTVAVRRLWKLKDAGLQIRKAWESFIKSHPRAVRLGLDYGTLAAKFDEDIAEAWTLWLEKTLNAKPKDGIRIKDNAKLWQAWEELSGDPEKWIPTWIEEGVPLGMSREIPVSDVFPPSTNLNAEEDHAPELEFLQGVENYKSFTDNPDDAQVEVDRYLKEGYAVLIDKAEAEKKFTLGTVSKLALIVKTKPDGSKKRRVVIDLRRSGGNALATCPEHLVYSHEFKM